MAYTPQTWVDNNASYPLSAARMNTMESGIAAAASVADQGHRILTTAERDALAGVTAGTMIYNSTLNRIQVYFNSAWVDADQFRTVGANNYSARIVPPACRAKRTDNTSYTSGAALSFDLEDFDTDGMHDTVTNNDRITIQTAGIYLVVFNYTFNYSGTLTKLQANLNVNGSALAYNMQVGSATGNIAGTFPFLYSYSASDYISVSVILTGATSITNASGSSTTSLSATWLGRTS